MKITVFRHVFGSIRGYTTLAKSGDLSPEETAKLEILSFGQTNESSYLDSLQTYPAYISRPLHSGKWAVTRVFQGKPDDRNRTTLLFISAVITIDDWLYSLKCDVNRLLNYPSLWQWNGEKKLEPVEITVGGERETASPDIRSKVVSLLGAVEKYQPEENTTIIVRTSDFDVNILRWLNMVLPESSKQTFSCAVRSLNDGLALVLVSMAKEGSVGNSKRRIINWTTTSTVENCPYTESIAQFWEPEGQPPWRFIDSCKSFQIDLGTKPDPLPQKRAVRKKRVSGQVKEPKVKHGVHVNLRLAVTLFIFVILAGLATVITIGTRHSKVNKENIGFLIEEVRTFLAQNSHVKYFPTDRATREQAIEKCGQLRYKLEGLLEQAKNPPVKARLKTEINKLKEWSNLAQDTNRRYNRLDRLFSEFEGLNWREPRVYPVPEITLKTEELRPSIANIAKANLAPNYVSREKEILQIIDGWRNKIKEIVLRKKDQITDFIASGSTKIQHHPHNYSDEQYKKCDGFKQNLQKLKEDETLKNASGSSYEDDKKIATEMIDKLETTLADYNRILKNLVGFKEDAKSSFNDANDILSDPNITGCTVDAIRNLGQARSHLDKARELWPKMPNLDGLNQKFTNNLEDILKKSEDKIKEMAKVEAPKKADVHRIKELRKILEKAKLISEKRNVQKIDDQLQQLENLGKKAMDVQASSLNSEQQMR